jgi:hypothetical protein
MQRKEHANLCPSSEILLLLNNSDTLDSNQAPPIPPTGSSSNEAPPIPGNVAPAIPSQTSRPPSSKQTNILLWIVGILGCFFLLGILLLVGGIYWGYQKAKENGISVTKEGITIELQDGTGIETTSTSGKSSIKLQTADGQKIEVSTPPGDAQTMDVGQLVSSMVNQAVEQMMASNPNVEKLSSNDPNIIQLRNKVTGKTASLNLKELQKGDTNSLLGEDLMAVFEDFTAETPEAQTP